MKVLKFLRKLWLRIQPSGGDLPGEIDTHKWESKEGTRKQLSSVFIKS